MANLVGFMYLSSAHKPFSAEELTKLLQDARRHNASVGVTGALLYARGTFIQYLEGPSSAVDQLFLKIRHDTRHHGIIELIHQPIEAREFGHWLMAFSTKDFPSLDDGALTSVLSMQSAQSSHATLLLQNFWTMNQAA